MEDDKILTDEEEAVPMPMPNPGASPTLISQDTLNVQAHGGVEVMSWAVVLQLAYQSIGVVYGDLGTSPLYVLGSTFSDGISHDDDLIGIMSLIYYTLTLLPILKYVFIVLHANDNGNGGTFALYSLLCRNAKVGLLPSTEADDKEVSTYNINLPKRPLNLSFKVKNALENCRFARFTLQFLTMLATALVLGDSILTPCISVLSAVSGIKEATPAMTEERVVWITVAILILLFSVQRFGTDKVGYSFAPILCFWFFVNAGIGLYNFFKYDPTVIKAVNPLQIVHYFSRNGKDAWVSLRGIVLCITGTEALFADLAHFTVRSIQISMCAVVYPSIMLAYSGQASYLRHHPEHASQAFYKAIPGPLYWPMFVVAVFAAIIASQAMISGAFSIIQQSLSLGCFPPVTIVHTSAKYKGQVYIPVINYFLLIACVCVTLQFRTTEKIGNAYGIAVVFAEVITSTFMVLVMILIWKKHILLVIGYIVVIMSVELTYLSSVLYKFPHGGYLPLTFACVLMLVMIVWNYVYREKYYYETNHKISPEKLREIVTRPTVCKIPGIAIFYSELVNAIPPIFEHYAANIPALHSVLVFVSIKSLPVSTVPPEERFLFRRVLPTDVDVCVFKSVVRYGYTDLRTEQEPFERLLVERLKDLVRHEEAETEALEMASVAGVVHLMDQSEVIAGKEAGLWKKITIDYFYSFLKKNLRQSTDKALQVPRERLLKVGITYEL